jgi:accessory colonization factor AcfC
MENSNRQILIAAMMQVSELILWLRANGQDSRSVELDNKRILWRLYNNIEGQDEDNHARPDYQ